MLKAVHKVCLPYHSRAVAVTTAGTAMAIPVFVNIKKKLHLVRRRSWKLVSWSQTLTCMRAQELEQPSRFKVQHMLPVELREWLSTASLVIFPRLVKYPPTRASYLSKMPVWQVQSCSRAFHGSLFGIFGVIFVWVIFSYMFQCLTCISLKWNWRLRSRQNQS